MNRKTPLMKDVLKQVLAEQGSGLLKTPNKLAAILRDYAPNQNQEIKLLKNSLQEGIDKILLDAIGRSEFEQQHSIMCCEQLLRDNLFISETASCLVVESIAFALGLSQKPFTSTKVDEHDFEEGQCTNHVNDPTDTEIQHVYVAQESTFAEMAFNMGLQYSKGRSVMKDTAKAAHWYRKAAEQGHIKAQWWLGTCYEDGLGITQDYNQAIRWYREAAMQGDAYVQWYLGMCYKTGTCIYDDFCKYLKHDWNLSQDDYYFHQLLNMYGRNDSDFKQDDWKAVYWFQKSAKQGYPIAQYHLGMCYANGTGIQQDVRIAEFWLYKAAEQGVEGARRFLNHLTINKAGYTHSKKMIYKVGYHTESKHPYLDINSAANKEFSSFLSAAKRGDADAQYTLGMCYYNGTGIKKNYHKAVQWYRKAAEQGHVEAQYILGKCYKEGKGVKEDDIQAKMWLKRAIKQGSKDARHFWDHGF